MISSILLAFGIDAGWDGLQQRQRERDLLSGLLSDFRTSRPGLESRVVLAQRMARGTDAFLGALEGASNRVLVPDSVVVAVLGGPTFEPDMNTLDAAVASGEIELISSRELQAELAFWRRALIDTSEDEREVRRITNEQLIPILARSVNLGPYMDNLLAWSGGDPFAAGRRVDVEIGAPGEEVQFASSLDLSGALALRRFYVRFSATDLEDLLASLDRAVALLEAELAR